MFLENPSSGTLKIERLESKIILKCLGVIRPKGVATVSFIGLQLDLYRVVTFWGYTYLYIKYGINKEINLRVKLVHCILQTSCHSISITHYSL